MKVKRLKFTRRTVLKSMAAVVATMYSSGCGSGSKMDSNAIGLEPDHKIEFDKEERTLFSTGSYNCGSRCQHKLHVKNNKLMRITSAGDKPRGAQSDKEAEFHGATINEPMELRACTRCYGGYQGVLYQPDRLKYPLKQTGERGDLNGFVRITWDEAMEEIVQSVKVAFSKRNTLGYVPIISRYFRWVLTASIANLNEYGIRGFTPMVNESYGGYDLGKWDSIGHSALSNSRTDRFNTKFMLTWALDTTRTTFYQGHTHFLNTKLKEGSQIPMVTISSTNSDAATLLSTGFSTTFTVGANTSNPLPKSVDVPGWIACRPTTDGALAAGFMYVMYKNGWYDTNFVNNYCFGFTPSDRKISKAPSASRGGLPIVVTKPFTDEAGVTFNAGDPFTDADIKVPQYESFVEYLLSREVEWGKSAVDAASVGVKFEQPQTPAEAGDSSYYNVLKYIAKLTGVKTDYIEAIAYKYAEAYLKGTGASFIEAGGGAQRTYNGGEWVWLMSCMTAMCGYIDMSGGGAAVSMGYAGDQASMSGTGNVGFGAGGVQPITTSGAIHYEGAALAEFILTGKDHRPENQYIEDVKLQTGGYNADPLTLVDFTGNLPSEIELMIHTNNNCLMTLPNTNKNIEAFKSDRVKKIVVFDQVMNPTAQHADIILPACTHLESESFSAGMGEGTGIFTRGKVCDPMYDTRQESVFVAELWGKLDAAVDVTNKPTFASMVPFDTLPPIIAEYMQPTQYYLDTVNPAATIPGFDELSKTGVFTLVVPPDKPFVPMKDLTSVKNIELDTSTGYINFYSPARALRPATQDATGRYLPGGWRHATACYQPIIEGFEEFFEDKNDIVNSKFVGFKSTLSNRTFNLIYMTNKSRARAHTVFDNVASIKDMYPQTVKLNPATAATYGIKGGDIVYVYNDRGCMKVPAEITQAILPGIASIEHGAWYRAHPNEKVTIYSEDRNTPGAVITRKVPVDVGGNDNVLTNDYFGEDSVFCGGAVPAQSGPCEISLINPDLLA